MSLHSSQPPSCSVRDRLLEHACRLFAEHGFRRTRTQDVCRAAGTNPTAVNYHFGGKEGLYKAVWDQAVASTGNLPPEASGSPNADREWLYQYLRASVLALFDAGPGRLLRRLIRHEIDDPSPLGNDVLERCMAPRTTELERRVRRMLGPCATEYQVACCMVAIHSQCTALSVNRHLRRTLFTGESPGEEEIQRLAREMCAFVIGGIRAIRTAQPKPGVMEDSAS